jgi:glycosyltransferase involved in cell wall biosynthesis
MTTKLVSIIIPAYRAARYLRETLESIRAQTHPHWEILIGEDGIFDDTAAVVAAFAVTTANPVRLFQNQTNLGVSRTRNLLLDAVKGDFVAFLDADDTWTPDHLAYSLARMEEEKTDWIIGGTNLTNPDGKITEPNILPAPRPSEAVPTDLLRHNFILTGGVVTRAKVFTAGLRFVPDLVIGEDLDVWIRIIEAGNRPSFSQRATFNYRKHPSSTTADPVVFQEEFARLYERYVGDPLVDQRLLRNGVADMLTSVARMTWRREPARALGALRRLFRIQPWHVQAWPFFIMAKASQLTSS